VLTIIESGSQAWALAAADGDLHVYSREEAGEWSEVTLSEDAEQIDQDGSSILEALYEQYASGAQNGDTAAPGAAEDEDFEDEDEEPEDEDEQPEDQQDEPEAEEDEDFDDEDQDFDDEDEEPEDEAPEDEEETKPRRGRTRTRAGKK
jgi:hypothetical protein